MSAYSKSCVLIAPASRWSGAVFHLFTARSPTTVFGRIRAVIVDAVELVGRRWFTPHVEKKIFINKPSLANGDAARSITIIPIIFWIKASIPHFYPSYPLSSQFFSDRISMFGFVFNSPISSCAATRSDGAFFKVMGGSTVLDSAITMTKPIGIALMYFDKRYYSQAAKSLAQKISDNSHVYSV